MQYTTLTPATGTYVPPLLTTLQRYLKGMLSSRSDVFIMFGLSLSWNDSKASTTEQFERERKEVAKKNDGSVC